MDTENLFHIEPSDLISDDEDEGVISIDVGLLPSSKGNEYRIFNDTTKPYQRTNAVDRKGRVNIRCKILDIVHGTLSPIGPPVYVSLVVLKCAFFSRKHSSRAVSADVQFIFKGLGQGAPDPEVADMTPRGKYCLMPATQQESVTTGATAGVQAPVAGQASLNWQRVSGREKKKYTTLLGETGVYERNSGDDNGLGWTLLENTITHDGVPESFQGAILLHRKDEASHFQAEVTITVQTDRWTAVTDLFRSDPLDDPILFDPTMPSTDKLRTYDTTNMANINLKDFKKITFMKVTSGVEDD